MNRYRNNGRYYGNGNYNNYNYNYYNSDYGDRFPEVARLPYKYLKIISWRARSRINPAVYDPNENSRHFKINCHASFNCNRCSNYWTSNRITVELWWKRGKKQFDVRMYGQQCKRCNREFIAPYINNVDYIMKICVAVLTDNYRGRGTNANKNTNTQFNSSHDEQRCQKCRMIGHPCW